MLKPKKSTKQMKAIYEQDDLYKRINNLVFFENKSRLEQPDKTRKKQPLRDQYIEKIQPEEYYGYCMQYTNTKRSKKRRLVRTSILRRLTEGAGVLR